MLPFCSCGKAHHGAANHRSSWCRQTRIFFLFWVQTWYERACIRQTMRRLSTAVPNLWTRPPRQRQVGVLTASVWKSILRAWVAYCMWYSRVEVWRLGRERDEFSFLKRSAGRVLGLVMVSLKCSWSRWTYLLTGEEGFLCLPKVLCGRHIHVGLVPSTDWG